MSKVILGLGCNVGDCMHNLQKAYDFLGEEVSLLVSSSVYTTKPWGKKDQPPFFNTVLEIETQKSPEDLLSFLHKIEEKLGRNRKKEERWGERTMDIDILFWEGEERNSKNLTLPHKFWKERDFVLFPLLEIQSQLSPCFSSLPFEKYAKYFDASALICEGSFFEKKNKAYFQR